MGDLDGRLAGLGIAVEGEQAGTVESVDDRARHLADLADAHPTPSVGPVVAHGHEHLEESPRLLLMLRALVLVDALGLRRDRPRDTADRAEGRAAFRSIDSLAAFVEERRRG